MLIVAFSFAGIGTHSRKPVKWPIPFLLHLMSILNKLRGPFRYRENLHLASHTHNAESALRTGYSAELWVTPEIKSPRVEGRGGI